MKNYSLNLTRTAILNVIVFGSALLVGCAGNGVKKTSTSSLPVAKQEQAVPDTQVAQLATTVSTDKVKDGNVTTIVHEEIDEKLPLIDISEKTQPEQMKFYFGFDRSELQDKDIEAIKQHARFMTDNPGLLLQISGHTDSHGPREYNEYLSKQRASEVAKVMIENGVPESQLIIKAMADEQPIANTNDSRKNRRVELEYQELNLVSNQ